MSARGLVLAPLIVPALTLLVWFPFSVYLSGVRAAVSGMLVVFPSTVLLSYVGLLCVGLPATWLLRRAGMLSRASVLFCGAVCGAVVLSTFAVVLSRGLGAYEIIGRDTILQSVALGAVLGVAVAAMYARLSENLFDANQERIE